jgi:hypothetical protein
MLNKIGTGIVILAAIAASGAFLVARAAPERVPEAAPAKTAAASPAFTPTCRANEVADIRPDPAWVGSSFARDNCWAPPMPARVDGYTASREQVMASIAAMKKYSAQADAYQRCIAGFVAKAEADKDKKPITVALITIENHRIAASENNKKKLAAQVDNTINAFNEYGSECPD